MEKNGVSGGFDVRKPHSQAVEKFRIWFAHHLGVGMADFLLVVRAGAFVPAIVEVLHGIDLPSAA